MAEQTTTTPTTATAPDKSKAPEPVATAPQPKAPTPLDPPQVYYNQKWRVPPLVVDTQEAADALDPTEWTTGAPPPAATKDQQPEEDYPQLYANVSVRPKIVNSKEEAQALGDGWSEFTLPDSLCKAAMKENAARAKAAAAKAKAQDQTQGQGQTQGQTPPPAQHPQPPTWNPQTGWSTPGGR